MATEEQHQRPFTHPIFVRALAHLIAGVTVVASVSVAALFFLEKVRLQEQIVKNGYGLLANLVENTRDSISMGQPATFQRVIDDFARLDGVQSTSMYSRSGLMNYLSHEVTVGKPFVRAPEGLFNPNRRLFDESRGYYQREDWALRDLDETEAAKGHIRQIAAAGNRCSDCHFSLQENLDFDAENRANRIGEGHADFYYRLTVSRQCIGCHTNWSLGATAGFLHVRADTSFFEQQQRENLRGMLTLVFSVVLPALGILVAVFRKQANHLELRVQERTAELAAARDEALMANRRLRELDQLKSNFLSSVSHELRTPLTSVIGFAKLIKKDFAKFFAPLSEGNERLAGKAERIEGNIGIIVEEGERLTRLINDVLDLSKIEAGRVEWRDSLIPVEELVRHAAKTVSGQFAHKEGVVLKVELGTDLPLIKADRDRMTQVLINLLNNAAKFTERGEVVIGARRPDSGAVQITVRDTGVGIPAEFLEKVFDKFQQVTKDDTLSDKPQGTGLGLPICKNIIEHYGGRIWAESQPGVGSTFFMLLPAEEDAAQGRTVSSPALSTAVRTAAGGQRILVVDDEPHVRELLVQVLSEAGYQVTAVADGREALDAARGNPPDLITMDLMMPGMDGYTAIAALRSDAALRRIPIVVISVLSERESAGGDAALGKPVEEARLYEAIDSLLQRKRPSGDCLVVRGAIEDPAPSLTRLVCSEQAEVVNEAQMWRRLEEGYCGTVVLSHGTLQQKELDAFSRFPGVQVVILPEREERGHE